MTERKIYGEQIQRSVTINEKRYILTKSWHYLNNGDQYHYIQVHRENMARRPFKSFRWTVSPDGKVRHV